MDAAAKDRESVLDKILPPRLEDAGLEDCALPPESINEAFLKAASAVKSRASSLFSVDDDEEEERDGADCLQDPFPADHKTDAVVDGGVQGAGSVGALVVGGDDAGAPRGSCVVEKGGGVVEEGRDEVVVVGGDGEEREGAKGKGCVGVGDWSKIGKKKNNKEKAEEEDVDERPTLTEGFVV